MSIRVDRRVGIALLALVLACRTEVITDPLVVHLPAPTVATDTVLFVGESVSAFALFRTASGAAFTPSATTSVSFQALTAAGSGEADALGLLGRSGAILVDGTVIRAFSPGTIRVTVIDTAAGWSIAARVGAVADIRRIRDTYSICYLPPNTVSSSQGPARISNFHSDSSSFMRGTIDGRPRWVGDVPTATIFLPGTQTDSTVQYYTGTVVQPINRQLFSVVQRRIVVAITADTTRFLKLTESVSGLAPFERQTTLVPQPANARYAGNSFLYCGAAGLVFVATPL